MSPLEEIILAAIKRDGPMDIGRFMDLALAHPQYGYYRKQDPLGRGGDFTTAPEISQMFGEMLGVWAVDTWRKLGAPSECILLECGPGRGTLMADCLRAAKGAPEFLKAAAIHLLETSPVLKEKQAEALKGYDVSWHEDLADLPAGRPVIVIANEFLDALPILQYERAGGTWFERGVEFKKKKFVIARGPLGPRSNPENTAAHKNSGLPRRLQRLAMTNLSEEENAIYEISPAREGWMAQLYERLKQSGGAGLFVDYGHGKTAPGDTLQAVYRHKYCGVLEHIGEADLTAHVDFEPLMNLAHEKGLAVHGLTEQSAFLRALGIDLRAQRLLHKANPRQAQDIHAALQRLTDPGQMGALFKVMGVSYGANAALAGF